MLIDEDNDGLMPPLVSDTPFGSDLPTRVTSLVSPASPPPHATDDDAMADAEDFGSEASKDIPPAFLARYAENQRRVLDRDRKYPESKQCAWTLHCNRFATLDVVRRYLSISSR